MECDFKKNYIILYNDLKKIKIIINFNNNSKDMVLNTICSINNFCKYNYENSYIINFNRYDINDKIKTKFKINNPIIKIFNINIFNYINSIKNKSIIDINELDRMIIIFSSKKFNDIIQYVEKTANFYNLIIELIS